MKQTSTTPPVFNGLIFSQSSANKAIPVLYGRTKISSIPIFAGNWKNNTGGGGLSGSGVPSSGSGGGAQTYSANFDLLLGFGPFQGLLGLFGNGQYYYMTYSSQTFTTAGPATSFTFLVTNQTLTVKYLVGIAVNQTYSVTYNDYGGPGSQSFSGTTLLPLYNELFPAPNQGDWQYGTIPYAQYNTGSVPVGTPTVTVVFPTSQASCTCTVYYAETGVPPAIPPPIPGGAFERELGSGSAYSFSGAPAQITYPEFSGYAGTNVTLAAPNNIGQYQFEAMGLYCMGYLPPGFLYQSGLTWPADVIADIICSGGLNNSGSVVWNHGLNFTSFPDVNTYNYSRYGGILDDEPNIWGPGLVGTGTNLGLNGIRNYCQAYGIAVAGVMDTQQDAGSWLKDLSEIANCAPAWDGAQLSFIPYCEISAYGNGASYVAPTASGPVFNFTFADFVVKKGDPPVLMLRSRSDENYNQIIVEFPDQKVAIGQVAPAWNTNSVTVVDELDMIQNGPMPGSVRNYTWIAEANSATLVGQAILNRHLIVERVQYKFSLNASWGPQLTPMILCTIYDPSLGLTPVPIRITSITEKEDWTLDIEAEIFAYGGSAPKATTTQNSTTSEPPTTQDPGAVSTPIIFESIPAIAPTGPELWICVGGAGQYYGGCIAYLSTDGGNNYTPVGTIQGSQTMGVTYSADFPIHVDPDTADTLNVDLTASTGFLTSYTAAQRDMFTSLTYLSPGGTTVVDGVTLTIPYELGSYETANLSAISKYAIVPTTRRGAYGTPIADHPIGSNFSFLADGRVFQLVLDSSWVGVTLYFKFTAFNTSGQNVGLLSSATAYTFTPTGLVGWQIPPVTTGPNPPTPIPTPVGSMANDFYIYIPPVAGTYLPSQELFYSIPTRSITLPASLTGTHGGARIAPTGSITITILKNGSSVGTVNIASSATTATYTFATATSWNGTTDTLSITAPATSDATLAGFWLDILAARSS